MRETVPVEVVSVRGQVIRARVVGRNGRIRTEFGSRRGLAGVFGFAAGGLSFRPWRFGTWLSGVGPQTLLAWDDVRAVDMTALWGSAHFTVFHRDDALAVRGSGRRAALEAALRSVGFEPHERPSWPGHRLYTRPGVPPDWNLVTG